LLADRRLGDPERFGDLPLSHPGRHHRAQGKHPPKPRDVLVAPSVAIFSQQCHKATLSGLGLRSTNAPVCVSNWEMAVVAIRSGGPHVRGDMTQGSLSP
jgi:hypothetical protein